MKLVLMIAASIATSTVFSETVFEAVHHSLILNSEVLLSTTNNLINPINKSPYLPKINLAASYENKQSFFNELKLDSSDIKNLKNQQIADDLALNVINNYLQVLLREKELTLAQNNSNLIRSVYLSIKKQQEEGKTPTHELVKITKRMNAADKLQIQADTNLKRAKNQYAKAIGFWPHNLEWPHLPTNKELPQSLEGAIEQGLDNYLVTIVLNEELKKRSMSILTEKVRISWEKWTKVGLEVIRLRKELTVARDIFIAKQQQFKSNLKKWEPYLNAQNDLYEQQLKFSQEETNEALARFSILNTVGKLVTYLNGAESEALNDKSGFVEQLQLANEFDKINLPYADYKPYFQSFMAHLTNEDASANSWYVSVGKFKNKANALALVEKLKDLGFIVFTETSATETLVLVGPYHYSQHASNAQGRLKEIAHLQGMVVNNEKVLLKTT